MKTTNFDYRLPPHLIAQEPIRPRDASRLLVLHRDTGRIEHRRFRDLPAYLLPTDVLIFNETRVIRARLRGVRAGGGKAEILLLEDQGDGVWEAVVSPGRRLPPGRKIAFPGSELHAEVLEYTPSGGRLIRFSDAEQAPAMLPSLGEMPLPPYITQPLREEGDYQTVYARRPGSSAAPTAGLHFTEDMLERIRHRVAAIGYLTLHIGLGTFRPIRVEEVEEHDMHEERYAIPDATALLVTRALAEGRRVLAVGTTSARALEAATNARGHTHPGEGRTKLFIRPGYRFKAVRALLTNFHMPRSTLLLLVSAFAGREHVLHAYHEAIAQNYRFLSFGDAMLII